MNRASTWHSRSSLAAEPLSPAAVEMPFQPGQIVGGKYEIHRLIGAGGMGFVVSALHLELGEVVALKFLRPEALQNEEIVGRFAREAQAAARIKSEHVARVFDVGRLPDGVPFIVMEHLDGKDLADVLSAKGRLSVRTAIEYVLQACEALAAAHAVGVVHRDIKPENLFLCNRTQGMEVIKILDFGISKVALTGSAFNVPRPMVRTMMPIGSPVYMSPEQIRGGDDIDHRTDIWSLGCVLFELLTGSAAFDAPSLMQLSASILEKDPPLLRSLLIDAPEELEAIVAKCLDKDPAKRFQNVAELAIALYPFGPRRARLSAERCYYLLEGSTGEYELPTVPPPRSTDSQSLPAVRTTGQSLPAVRTTGQQEWTNSAPQPSLLVQATDSSRMRLTSPEPRTSSPAAISIAEVNAMRQGPKGRKIAFLLGAAAALGAIVSVATRGGPADPARASAPAPKATAYAAAPAAPTSGAALPNAAHTETPTAPSVVPKEPTAPAASAQKAAEASVDATGSKSSTHTDAKSKHKVSATPSAKPTASTRKEEPDVGF